MFNPRANLDFSKKVVDYYIALEYQILQLIAGKIDGNIDGDVHLMNVSQQSIEIRRELSKLIIEANNASEEELKKLIEDIYGKAMINADSELRLHGIGINADDIPGGGRISGKFGIIHRHAIDAVVADRMGLFNLIQHQIYRSTNDIYRQIIMDSAGPLIIGAETRRQAAQRALNSFADKGVKGFIDKAGRLWNLASYVEMATRTGIIQANLNGHFNRLQENGNDLVIVSSHGGSCPLCSPWEGRVLSISGEDNQYPSVDDARGEGLWHPNCGHTAGIYIEGLTKPLESQGALNPEFYEEKQRQRAIERNIRKWKAREVVAITDEEKVKAKAKVREWQFNMREHISSSNNDLRRNYRRESINGAR